MATEPKPEVIYPDYIGTNGIVFDGGPLNGDTIEFTKARARVYEQCNEVYIGDGEYKEVCSTYVSTTCESTVLYDGMIVIVMITAKGNGEPGEYTVPYDGGVSILLGNQFHSMTKGSIELKEVGGTVRGTFWGRWKSKEAEGGLPEMKISGAFSSTRQ